MKKIHVHPQDSRVWRVGLLLVVLLALTACTAHVLATEQPASAPTATIAPTAMPVATADPVATEAAAPAAEARPSFVPPELLALPQEAALIPSAQSDLAALEALPEYTIQLKVDLEASAFSGKLQLDYYHNEDTTLDRLYFRLLPNGGASYGAGSLQIDSLSLWGEPLEY
ncbi:MAG TPA: hypothetical protein VLS48_08200, partial [Anaerolineales bacterium]|nr:hypothetical protein [Anaerolineales bacterium]